MDGMKRPEVVVTYYGDDITYEVAVNDGEGPEGVFVLGKQRLANGRGELFYGMHRSARMAAVQVRLALDDGNPVWTYAGDSLDQEMLQAHNPWQMGALLQSPVGSALFMLHSVQFDMLVKANGLRITVGHLAGYDSHVHVYGQAWRFVRAQLYSIRTQTQ